MEIPGLGTVELDEDVNGHCSRPLPLALLGGQRVTVIVQNYERDPAPEELHAAIAQLLSADGTPLASATPYVYAYYEDARKEWEAAGEPTVAIDAPGDVWKHVQPGAELTVTRNTDGDGKIYLSLECNCDWEQEHGLSLVFDHALRIVKVGAFDGHLTNADAYAEPKLANTVYVSREMLRALKP